MSEQLAEKVAYHREARDLRALDRMFREMIGSFEGVGSAGNVRSEARINSGHYQVRLEAEFAFVENLHLGMFQEFAEEHHLGISFVPFLTDERLALRVTAWGHADRIE